jgi:DNA-binding MarR family transcriptional regulator
MRLVQTLLPGFKGWQGAVLRALYFAPDHELLESDIADVTMIVDREIEHQLGVLEQDGFITRSNPREERPAFIKLTPDGVAISEKLLPARARLMTELCRSFTDDEKVLLNSLLERL